MLNCLQIFRIVQLASSEPAFKHMVSMVANEVRVVKLCRLLKLGKLVELIDPQKLSTLLAAALEPLGIHGVVRRLSRTTQARLVLLPWAVTISRHLTCNLTSTRADLPEHVSFLGFGGDVLHAHCRAGVHAGVVYAHSCLLVGRNWCATALLRDPPG